MCHAFRRLRVDRGAYTLTPALAAIKALRIRCFGWEGFDKVNHCVLMCKLSVGNTAILSAESGTDAPKRHRMFHRVAGGDRNPRFFGTDATQTEMLLFL